MNTTGGNSTAVLLYGYCLPRGRVAQVDKEQMDNNVNNAWNS